MKIFDASKNKSREYVNIILMIITNFIVLYLFDVDIRIFFVILLIDILILTYYFIISSLIYKKEMNKDEKIQYLENNLRDEQEKNLRYKNDLKDYFLTWIHQIKTPITSIKLLAESLDEQNKEKLKILSLSIENYTEIALSYLKLIDFSSDLEIKKIEISSIVKKIIRKYKIHFISTNTKLHYDDFVKEIISDSNYIEIMIEQIINNALKYALGKDIYIGFKEDYLYIKDTGLGIEKDKLKRIFDRGYSVSNEINPNKSSGIGLYIVKRISDKLNHRVEVESKPNEFTEFRIYFFQS